MVLVFTLVYNNSSAGGLGIECSLTVRKVMGSIPGRVNLKTVGTRCFPAKHSTLKVVSRVSG